MTIGKLVKKEQLFSKINQEQTSTHSYLRVASLYTCSQLHFDVPTGGIFKLGSGFILGFTIGHIPIQGGAISKVLEQSGTFLPFTHSHEHFDSTL